MADGAGRPTELTDNLLVKIKQGIIDGKNLKEIAQQSEIEINTFYDWTAKNYMNLADKIEGWKRDRKLILAEITSDFIQTVSAIDGNGKVDKELLKIKQKEAEFIRETLGKKSYSKRTELTGNDGKDLLPSPILAYVRSDDSHKESTESQ